MRHPQQKAMKFLSASTALPSLAVLQLVLIIQLFQTPATILAQRLYSINLYDCPDDTTNKYATDSQFEKNLRDLFPSLISHGSRDGGFFNTSSGAGQDTIYGLVQCRFDVSKGDCQRCLSIASVLILKKCPHQMDAVIRLEDCLFRYSNVIFFSKLRNLDDLDSTSYTLDYINISDPPAFNKQLKGLFTNLTSLAISKPSKYQTGSSNFSFLSDNILIYGLVECTRDLSNADCRTCLQFMVSKIRDCCNGYKSACVLSLSCQIWYRDFKFFEPPIHRSIQRPNRPSPGTTHPDSPSPRTSPGSPSPRTSPGSPSPAANVTGDTNGTKNKTHQENSKARIYMVVIPVVAAVVLFAFAFSICLLRRKATREKADTGTMQTSAVHLEGATSSPSRYLELNESERKGVDVPLVDFDTILTATDNFSISNKLGQGGFGPVYKGTLKGGQELAVKRLSRSSGQGLEEFRNEVLLIAKLQHRNLVKLLGYCIKDDEKVLLYEYMPNKSLDSFIFDRTLSLTINWEKRFDIILGIARGILYLHQDSRLRIIHRDLKTSNILLDEEMNPKISDFGLARICGGTETEGSTNRVVGTYGYMAPEYALDGLFSVKSDVYSFGVVLLEIVSGKKNSGFHVSEDSLSFIRYAWRLWNENKVLDFLDDSLCEACNASEVLKCIQVGLLCVQEDANDRPTMSSAVLMLGSEATNLPTPKQPAFVFRRYQSTTTTTSSGIIPESCLKNEITVSAEEGR